MKTNLTPMTTGGVVAALMALSASLFAQDPPAPEQTSLPDPIGTIVSEDENPLVADDAALTAEVGGDGGRIVVEAKGVRPRVPVFFSAGAESRMIIGADRIDYESAVTVKVLQGNAKLLRLGIGGSGDIDRVTGPGLKAWAVRQEGKERFLELEVEAGERKEFRLMIVGSESGIELPAVADLLHLRAGKAVGFASTVRVDFSPEVSGRLAAAEGFLPLEVTEESRKGFQGAGARRLAFHLFRSSAVPAPVELEISSLNGTVDEEEGRVLFEMRASATVSENDAAIDILRGGAALEEIPEGSGWRVRLATESSGDPVYRLQFDQAGRYDVTLKLSVRLQQRPEFSSFDFEVRSGSVIPVVLRGIAPQTEFSTEAPVIPVRDGNVWRGFLPASGRCQIGWRPRRKAGEGKLFFNTVARSNVGVGAGLLRQSTEVDFRILQGKLGAIRMGLAGPGEILSVEGANVLGWKVVETDGLRVLEVELNQPIEGTSSLEVRSQLALGAFPVRAGPLRVLPEGASRHSGFVRVYNVGATRLEVAGVAGMTQLSPDQYPDEKIKGGDRQVFVYRFPAAEHSYEVVADRVQPEVNLSQLVVYELSETDRVLRADVELDIREAPLREWEIRVPEDYSVVAVSGAEVSDNQVGTTAEDGFRSVMVIFGKDVIGRQLVQLHLEKNEPAGDGEWILPRLRYPDAKSVRGEVGIASVPGFRLGTVATEKLTEIPLSRFHSNRPDLQQAFRIREREWSATMTIETLPQSVQADVFHLYSLKDQTAYASVVVNYFITGAPVGEWNLSIPAAAGNLAVEGKDVRTWRREKAGETGKLVVSLHQGVVGPYTLLVTYEEPVGANGGAIRPGRLEPEGVRSERGFIQVVSPVQVDVSETNTRGLLKLDPLELPAEFRLLSAAPALATFQYTSRDFDLSMGVEWFEPGETVEQVVEFAEAESGVSRDGEVVTEVTYFVKSRGRRILRTRLPANSRLWEVLVNGRTVSAREDGEYTLIPLPAGADANVPVQVKLRLGRPAADRSLAVVTLPTLSAPVLKTEWKMRGEPNRVLVPKTGGIPFAEPALRETGLEWISSRALVPTIFLALVLAAACWVRRIKSDSSAVGWGGLVLLVAGLLLSFGLLREARTNARDNLEVLNVTLPVVAADQQVSLVVGNYKRWEVAVSHWGVAFVVVGIGLLVWSVVAGARRESLRFAGSVLLPLGILLQRGGAAIFYLVVAVVIAALLIPPIVRGIRNWRKQWEKRRDERRRRTQEDEASPPSPSEEPPPAAGPSVATLILLAILLVLTGTPDSGAAESKVPPPPPVIPAGLSAADSLVQKWQLAEGRLEAAGTITVTGKEGESFLLLSEPAVLTNFKGKGLRIEKRRIAGFGTCFVISVRKEHGAGNRVAETAGSGGGGKLLTLKAEFSYEMNVGGNERVIAVPTGPASVREVDVTYDKPGWEFDSPGAMGIGAPADVQQGRSGARLLLAPRGGLKIMLRPKSRDIESEETRFFVEVANLFLPSPGVVDVRHLVKVRPSQGQVRELTLEVPDGFTVSDVTNGPVGNWQFDPEAGTLEVVIEPPQAQPFTLLVETQDRLGALPADLSLEPISVAGAAGQVGLAALAFGPEAQPENPSAEGMSAVNISDFDPALLRGPDGKEPVLHRVYRYGEAGGAISLRVAPVAPELRVVSQEDLSIGDEELVLRVNFRVDILRAGIFQMSFALPDGLEVDSLTGPALRHWTEFTEDGQRRVILHLNGKTIGTQQFALALSGPTPSTGENGWIVPRFEVREAARQTGDLVVRPTTGIRLQTLSRRNVSEIDPREVGAKGEGALAFRILQRDWELRLGIEKLDPWLTGVVLHDLKLREGQTRTGVIAQLRVENASIGSLVVRLPGLSEEEAKTVRVTGTAVSDIVPVDSADETDEGLWQIQFKRRMIGDVSVRLEYERTGERADDKETLRATVFPDLRQSSYYFAVRAGARMDLETGDLPQGWQRVDWNAVPQKLREAGDRSIPALTLRALDPAIALALRIRRHSAASALKLRVAGGTFATVVSPVGEILTAVDLRVEVIQRSTLRVTLPSGGALYNVFVNGESVSVVREGGGYQFYILPGPDDRSANVRFVYSLPGQDLRRLRLGSPLLNVPLENIEWRVIVPSDFELVKDSGDLDLRSEDRGQEFGRGIYLATTRQQRAEQAKQAEDLLERANSLLQQGEQEQARIALNSVANNYALDAASNEDARVQLRELQTQQVIVGLNTRRQRLYLDNRAEDPSFRQNAELEMAAVNNGIINMGEVKFRPQEFGRFLQGNTKEENDVLSRIAARLVTHQRSTEPAPQAISVTLPEEGRVFSFARSVQVEEDAPLELKLRFESPQFRSLGKETLVVLVVMAIAGALVLALRKGAAQ